MKRFEHNGQKYIAVGTRGFYEPEDTYQMAENDHTLIIYRNNSMVAWENLPPGNYEIVGLVGKIRNNHSNGFEFFMDAINNNPWNAIREFNNLSDNDLILKYDNNHSNER